ncbi:hypothetical protein L6452_22974 [Arctium lappa]|uniref:Uncharacterized protein n=1 Tax=Arctium lappa TaxID=4217 RepID=A0ACB9B0D6_ARCLA|nr:hypothetical protein L6452_22974 [Arctium lappa]
MAVSVLFDTLLDCTEKRVPEIAIIVLDQRCQCVEGRADLLKHGSSLAVVSKTIFRMSPAASEIALRILYSVSMFSGNSNVVQEMLQVGAAEKLFLVLQVDRGSKMKGKAKEILKMYSRVWKKSPCILNHLISLFHVFHGCEIR